MQENEPISITIKNPGPMNGGRGLDLLLVVLAVLGLAVFVAALLADPTRAWYNYLINYVFFMALAVAGVVLTGVHYASGATWSVTMRRVAEGMSAYLPVSLLLCLPLFFAIPTLYEWASPEHVHLHGEKHLYLCKPCFMGRQVLCYAVWIGLGMLMVCNSLRQDKSGDHRFHLHNRRIAPLFLILFALTITFCSVDLLMSLEEAFYSTMFPVYIFAGLFLSGYALASILVIVFRRRGYLAEAVRDHHLRDMATWMMAFSVFMVYIGFSQYMLIWYANLPIEIGYMMRRSTGGWGTLFVLLPVLKWLIPFIVLMPERFRRSERVILAVSSGVLVGQWLDIYWMVVPVFSETFVPIGWMELGVFVMFAALFGLSLRWFYRRYSLVAIKDPRLEESLKGRYMHV